MRSSGRDPLGFLAVEVLLAMAITAMVAVGTIVLLTSISSGSEAWVDVERANMKGQLLRARVESAITQSSGCLTAGDDLVVVWIGDRDRSGSAELAELVAIRWDADTQQVTQYRCDDTSSWAQTAVAAGTDAESTIRSLIASGSLSGKLLGRDVSDCRFSIREAASGGRDLIKMSSTLSVDGSNSTLRILAAPRGRSL